MASEPTTGVINSPNPKPPKPKPSPKKFVWPNPDHATDKDKKHFAAALQELLPTKQWTHAGLAEQLWGRDNNTARNIGKARDWVRGEGRFPKDNEAGYVAQLLGVSMQRLLEPKGAFDPTAGGLIRPMRPRQDWNTGKKKEKANGHDTSSDTRWIRPEGVAAPVVKFETSKKHATLVSLEVKGDMPVEVAMAVLAMTASKAAD